MRISAARAAVSSVLVLSCLTGCQHLASPEPGSHGEPAIVRQALSGQTVEILRRDNRATLKLRLIGIDAPDRRQAPWGERARQYLEALTLNREATIELLERDRYGRERGYLWIEGTLVNEQLVAAGHALTDDNLAEPDYARRLQRAQERARLLGLGIWDPHQPLREHPQTFRTQRRNFPDNDGNPPS